MWREERRCTPQLPKGRKKRLDFWDENLLFGKEERGRLSIQGIGVFSWRFC